MKRAMLAALLVICSVVVASYPQEHRPDGSGPKLETGQINGAAFRIMIPANWNRGLVMYCHGYQMPGAPQMNWDDPQTKRFGEVFLSRGFALAASAYSADGWAVKEAIEDTEALRRYFVGKYGQPRETYVMGHSMGGHITVATIEKYPEVYDGAMPLCGPLSPALDFFEARVFDMLVAFEYYFPGTVGSPVGQPADLKFSLMGSEKVREAIKAAPEKAQMFARRFNITVAELPGVLSFFQSIMKELLQRTGGNPFDNRNTIYEGFDDDAAVNRGVKRFAADAKAREYIRQYYTPTGRISDPVLTVHTTYDQLVPARDVSYYDVLTAVAGAQDLFVEKFVVAKGHCAIAPEKIAAAFDDLLAWARSRKRAAPGEIP